MQSDSESVVSSSGRVSRRAFLGRAVVAGGGMTTLLLAACSPAAPAAPAAAPPGPTAAPAAPTAPPVPPTAVPTARPLEISTAVAPTPTTAPQSGTAAVVKNAWGRQLPADAAPLAKQLYLTVSDPSGTSYKTMDFYESVYARAPLNDVFSIPLTRIDNDYVIHPGQAEKWESSPDGLTWTFTLKKGTKWSDGVEVTAKDYVETFRYSADPKHAWDFTWYWTGVIKNYAEATKGTVQPSDIGVRQGDDAYTLIFDTETAAPYLPAQLLYSWPLSAAALAKFGSGVYNTNPATCVSCGPWVLKEWSPDSRVILAPNTAYQGEVTPLIEQQVAHIIKGGNNFQRFQAGEIDSTEVFGPDIKIAKADPTMKDLHLYVNPQDFRTLYAFFDVHTPPWDNLNVRQAFAHSVDRDSLISSILAPLAVPAYGILMPGFPSSITDPLKPLTDFDPAKAKQLLAAGGYPDGTGFPEVTMFFGAGAPTDGVVVQALIAGWQQVLGVTIKLQQLDTPTFWSRVNNKSPMPFAWTYYGMDYFDPSNFMSLFMTGGQHNWDNPDFDKIVKEANPLSDQDKRNALYAEAQKMLTENAMSVFVYHQLRGFFYQPYFKGEALAANRYGYDGLQWSSTSTAGYGWQSLYIGNNVDQFRHGQV
jgi:ABC-type transport system substrate-binding protein